MTKEELIHAKKISQQISECSRSVDELTQEINRLHNPGSWRRYYVREEHGSNIKIEIPVEMRRDIASQILNFYQAELHDLKQQFEDL